MLYFPKSFDINESVIILLLTMNVLIFMLVPKRLPKAVTSLIVLLSMSFPKVMDHTIAVKPFNYYDLGDSARYEIFDLLSYGVFPAFGYMFIYFIDLLDLKHFKLTLYFIAWSLFAVAVEYIAVKAKIFEYNRWKLIYSLPVYIVVLFITYLFYEFLMQYSKKSKIELK
ncbi:hypothetical protein [Peribacillus sp. SCS-155]|uniref:hypothetical protein n=1 Tax=Peribacillus sedimenti TaxID=3115297 RepID=UPI0039068702